MPGRRRRLPVALLFALTVLVGCGQERRANVLIVTFDTTRADHIGVFGNDRVATPAVDGLAAEGVAFTNAHASIPLTLPSHTTILTGLYPTGHGIRDNGLFILSDEVVTLAERLKEVGYATAASISGFPLVERFNLDQGFDFYDDDLRRQDEDFLGRRPRRPSLYFEERQAGRTNEAILPWLAEHASQPFFAWVHYYDPHRPWNAPAPYDELYADDPYLAEIAYTDEALGQLLDKLRELGVYDDTLVVMTADHGEGLGEHNESTHSLLNYETTLRVPMVIRPPGGMEPLRTADLVAGVDVTPTVLDALGLEVPESLHGHSLAGYLSGGPGVPANRQFYAETLSPRLSHGWGELRSLYQGDLKYVYGPRPELYDLGADPNELDDLNAARQADASEMRQALERLIEETAAATAASTQPIDDETRAKLMALGYLSGSGDSEPIVETLLEGGIAPQDRVVDINLSSEARNLLTAGRGGAARQVAIELLERDPGNAFYRELLVQAAMLAGDLDEAVAELRQLVEAPRGREASVGVLLAVGGRLVATGRPEEAMEFLEKAVELDGSAGARYHLASAHRAIGDVAATLEALEAAVEADPLHVEARVDLAIQHAMAGRTEEARSHFAAALEGDPFYPKGHYNYGAFLLEQGDVQAALPRFLRAAEIAPGYLAARLAIVVTRLQLNDLDGARRELEELERVAPESEESRDARVAFDRAVAS